MIRSMTSFGRSKYEINAREYCVEIKSVNHKYNDITIKINRNISYLEDAVRKKILQYITRGKIEVYISLLDYSETAQTMVVNQALAKQYITELEKLAEETGISKDISIMEIAKLPDVMNFSKPQTDELIEKELLVCITKAIEDLIIMRENEGKKIQEDLEKRIDKIKVAIEEISNLSTGLIAKYIVKLEERIKEILKTDVIDQNRLAQEVVLYADKSSIEEEIIRLRSHTSQFSELLQKGKCVGKQLDFLTQEMNREINTIASKANCLEIIHLVINVKTEIENIREQVQNIE